MIVTIFGYGLKIIDPSLFAILRDGVWILICVLLFLINIKYWKSYIKERGKIIIRYVLLLVFWILISFFLFNKSWSEILIGIKYGLRYLMILLTASGLGFFLKKKEKKLTSLKKILKRSLVSIVILGWLRQIAKLLFPDFFFSLGYGKLDNFHFGVNPPIYYLTGFEGSLRWQGLFAWPNNYGYFLVLFLPLMISLFPFKKFSELKKWEKTDWLHGSVLFLWILTLWATLSRWAFIGAGVIFLITQFSFLKKNKKLARGIIWILILGILWLSALKRESTLAHLHAKFWGIQQVINAPLGYGLWTSWPAVHHSGKLLPENYYLQLMLDLGTIGFLMRCGIMILLFKKQKDLINNESSITNNTQWMMSSEQEIIQLFVALQEGLIAFLIIGLFLHIFEDSMVNYLFFIPYGLLLGWISALNIKKKWSSHD